MGILNLTPDSFYDGNRHNSVEGALRWTDKMIDRGAAIIDVGGYSSRPSAPHIDEMEERRRVIPCIRALSREFPDMIFSIDTFRSGIARAAVDAGAQIVNDISGGGLDKDMFATVAELQVPYILMHLRGTPQNMQENTGYNDLVEEVTEYFNERLQILNDMGVCDVLLDPGFGFSKDINGNYTLLHRLDALSLFERPVLVGVSRKSMIQKVMGSDDAMALKGTMALNLIALLLGASVLRVHDVAEGREMVELYRRLTAGAC